MKAKAQVGRQNQFKTEVNNQDSAKELRKAICSDYFCLGQSVQAIAETDAPRDQKTQQGCKGNDSKPTELNQHHDDQLTKARPVGGGVDNSQTGNTNSRHRCEKCCHNTG